MHHGICLCNSGIDRNAVFNRVKMVRHDIQMKVFCHLRLENTLPDLLEIHSIHFIAEKQEILSLNRSMCMQLLLLVSFCTSRAYLCNDYGINFLSLQNHIADFVCTAGPIHEITESRVSPIFVSQIQSSDLF